MTPSSIPNQRAVIDRRALAAAIADTVEATGAQKARPQVVELLRRALADGREEIARRLEAKPSAGSECAEAQAFLVDQLVRLIHDHVMAHVYPVANRSTGERLTVMAVGGYGRGEMAPHSDVDIAFLTPSKQTSWCEQVIEAMLYFLWDLGLKIGQSSRSLDEMVRMAKGDLTICTALLEGRYVWGDQDLFDEARRRFWAEVTLGTESQFVTEKLAGRKQFTRWALTQTGTVMCPVFPGCSAGFQAIEPEVRIFTKSVQVGNALVLALPLRALMVRVIELIKKEKYALLCNQYECERCAEVRKT